jgi:hypothetical protein
MLEIKRTAISLDENDLVELERISIDGDKEGALGFLKKVYTRIIHSQQGQLKSHLDTGVNSVEGFTKDSSR